MTGQAKQLGYKQRRCFCGETAARILAKVPYEDVLPGVKEIYFNQVVQCERCGFVYTSRVLDDDLLLDYYAQSDLYEYDDKNRNESSGLLKKSIQQAEYMERHLGLNQKTILDIGCATGLTLNICKERFRALPYGVDPSSKCARLAEKNHGIIVKQGDVYSLPEFDIPGFDIISLAHVLEHLSDLNKALASIKSLMDRKSQLYIEVPDLEYFHCLKDVPYGSFSFEHLNYFSKSSLQNLMAGSGLEPTHITNFINENGSIPGYPVIGSLWHLSEKNLTFKTGYQSDLKPGIEQDRAYIDHYLDGAAASIKRINSLLDDCRGQTIALWGAGTHTSRIFALTRIKELKISCIVDSSPGKWGQTMAGIPICSPDSVPPHVEKIIISSYSCMDDIYIQIKGGYPHIPIIKLYE